MSEAGRYRLPRNVTPLRYQLSLNPNLETCTFTGEESVELTVREDSDQIKLNAVELEIFTAELVNDAGDIINGEVTLDDEAGVATIDLEHTAGAGRWNLNLTFGGVINDKLAGFYRSTFVDDQGTTHTIATTQFEATDARRAFPCWDEPDLKAVFSVTLIVDDQLAAFSNAEVQDSVLLDNGRRQITFADTIKMSTYLVAYVVGPLVATEPVHSRGVAIRVACVPGRLPLANYALECAVAALEYFSDYFEIPYPASKIDLIALPDFAAGAMENFGCITFRETALLVDTDRASRREMERVAEVVGHELAHMWFGDLVTMKWWNGLWLNEAFATFMENLFVDNFRPDWGRWTSFGVGKAAAMDVDGLQSSRPIEFNVGSPDEASEMFDLLTYKKGGSVLRMLEQHIGPENFRRGISTYLARHAYANAETTDLWDALDETTDEPVRQMMDGWIFTGGHPLINAELSDGQLHLSQQRFLFLQGTDTTTWSIPIAIRTDKGEQLRVLLNDASVSLDVGPGTTWAVVNVDGQGFFPVSYSPAMLSTLAENLDQLNALERFSLATDTWNTCRANRVELADVLDLTNKGCTDTDPNVWRALGAPLRAIDHLVEDSDRHLFRTYVQSFARPLFDELGWDRRSQDDELTATLRSAVIGTLGGLGGDQTIRAEAAQRFGEYLNGNAAALDAELVATAQLILAATNETAHYETLLSRFKNNASSPQEKIVALQALACFDEPSLVQRTLGLMENDEIRSQDTPLAIAMMLTRRRSAALTWSWLEANWDGLVQRLPTNLVDRMIEGVTACYEPELLGRVDAFITAHPLPQAMRALAQTQEKLRINQAFYQRNHGLIGQLLTR